MHVCVSNLQRSARAWITALNSNKWNMSALLPHPSCSWFPDYRSASCMKMRSISFFSSAWSLAVLVSAEFCLLECRVQRVKACLWQPADSKRSAYRGVANSQSEMVRQTNMRMQILRVFLCIYWQPQHQRWAHAWSSIRSDKCQRQLFASR